MLSSSKIRSRIRAIRSESLVRPGGFEPTTYSSGRCRSIQSELWVSIGGGIAAHLQNAAGHMFATVMFTRVHVPREKADRFSTVALGVKRGLLRLVKRPVFAN